MKPKFGLLPLVAGASTALIIALPARADVFGRLRIVVRNADTQKPVPGATITLRDSAGVRSDLTLTPDAATGEVISNPIENRAFSVSIAAEGFTPDTRTVVVVADTTTDVLVDLEPAEKTIRITGDRTALRPRQTVNSTNRSSTFIQKFPVTINNPQQLQGVIASTPGVALDSNNQAHVRGEHTQTSLYIGGFQLGGALAGRFGPLLVPDALENIEVQTGAFAPEYGSETAAILNTTIKQGTIEPTFNVQGGGGAFSTRQGSISFGGQFGGPLRRRVITGSLPGSVATGGAGSGATGGTTGNATDGITNGTTDAGAAPAVGAGASGAPAGEGSNSATAVAGSAGIAPESSAPSGERVAQKFRYFLNSTGRSTNNALEAPQPGNQTANNDGRAQSYLGRFDYVPNETTTFTLTLNEAPGRVGVANRTGLPERFAGVGQGFGYAGATSRADALASGNPFLSQTQDAAGQDITQKDRNSFSILQLRHLFSDQLTGLVSLGATRSTLDVTNRNPSIYQDLSTLGQRPDAAIEFSPTVNRTGKSGQIAGSLSYALERHTVKFGFLNDDQRGTESYQLTPGSQLALNALFGSAPQLAGFTEGGANNLGTPQVDANGDPVLDANDNPVYNLNPGVTALPRVNIRRDGYYRALYLQDTWRVGSKLTANYGLRYDMFKRNQTTGGEQSNQKKNFLGPRLNLSYAIQNGLIARASYNRLFIQPPLANGARVGTSAEPETLNQYETSLEKQFGRQSVKASYFYKQIRNQLDIALLVPGSQIGIYSAVNLDRDQVHGLELSYDLAPRNGVGLGGYLSASRSVAKFNDAEEGRSFNDHDQRYTVSSGLNYTLRNGASAAAVLYYGSGIASSAIDGGLGSIFNGKRESRTRVDLRFSSGRGGPRILRAVGGLNLDIENVFNDRSLINFGSDFSGTRFQQGRRIVLSTNFGF
ncbi:MAG TPA: TonB-dependent receptor [Abditibacterium sp.]|jgi:outer membrane receptor protein involved in Fe transport